MLNKVVIIGLFAMALSSSLPARAQSIETLHSQGPYEPFAERMTAFGQLVGDWDLVVEYRQDDGSWQRTLGEWHFGWILQGRAIQDVWIAYRPGAMRGDHDSIMGYGTTIRVYDAQEDVWRVNWMGVLNHNYTRFLARVIGTEIIMEAGVEEGDPLQWVFHDITDSGFHWRAQTSADGGQTWTVVQRMTAVRRGTR